VTAIDTVLQQFSVYNNYEDEGDRAKRLKKIMVNAENFAVAEAQNKKHLRAISLGNSASPASPHGSAYRY